MIRGLGKDLAVALAAQSVPFRVVFGPEPTKSLSSADERIVIWQPTNERRDSIEAPIATHRNPRMPRRRLQHIRVRIYARANLLGAEWLDHAERAEEVVDHIVAELEVIVKNRGNIITYGQAGFVVLEDAQGSGTWAGALYELDLFIDRGILRRTWAQTSAEDVEIGTDVEIVNTVKVSNAPGPAGTPPPGAEIAAGG